MFFVEFCILQKRVSFSPMENEEIGAEAAPQ